MFRNWFDVINDQRDIYFKLCTNLLQFKVTDFLFELLDDWSWLYRSVIYIPIHLIFGQWCGLSAIWKLKITGRGEALIRFYCSWLNKGNNQSEAMHVKHIDINTKLGWFPSWISLSICCQISSQV